MTQERYNGWTNYATWGVALVLDNDEGTYSYVRERLAELSEEADDDGRLPNGVELRYELADWLEDYTERLCGLEGDFDMPEPSLMARQVLQAGLAEVNWDEIALSLIAE